MTKPLMPDTPMNRQVNPPQMQRRTLAAALVSLTACPLPAGAQPAGMPPAPSIMGQNMTSGPRTPPPAPATPGAPAAAPPPGPSAAATIRSELTVQRVVREGNGPERLEPVSSQMPGDLIQVTVKYTNPSKETVSNTDMTLPIPSGTTYVPKSLKDAAWTGSRDGMTFALLTGTDADRSVRQVRLRVPTIPAGKVGTFSFRVLVDGQPVPKPAAAAATAPQ
jgi:uncharacterized repeat protein (TIGR01451 family)